MSITRKTDGNFRTFPQVVCFPKSCINENSGNSNNVISSILPFFRWLVDFLKSPSSCLFSTCRTKDFSYLIATNFSNPKTGRCASTNQSSPGYPMGTELSNWCATKRDLIKEASKAAGHHVFLSVQIFRHKYLPKVNLRLWISPFRRSIQDSN